MADTITPNISIAMYRYLCKHIVGTEDHVKTIRMMNAVRDIMASSKVSTAITSGSFGEGLDMRGSDLDIMLVDRNIEVCEDVTAHCNPNISFFSMETDDVKPGFTQLRLEYNRFKYAFEQCEQHNGKNYYSSALLKQRIMPSGGYTHGPCITDKKELMDIVVCLHCKTWISPAQQWITRSSNSWPCHNVTQSIINHGVLFVPIGVKGSPKEDLEWRISFSVGEKFLINTFTHTQLLCYALLKILLKDVIAAYSECKDLLCSYFLKTIIFWISEELPQSIWKPDNLIPCFMRCFIRLIYCVENSVCLHYFIPDNNMFEGKIEGHVREILLEKLCNLYSYGWQCILFSDQLSNLNVSMWHFPIESHSLYANDVEKLLKSRSLLMANVTLDKNVSSNLRLKDVSAIEDLNISNKGIIQKFLRQQSLIKHVCKYYMSLWSNAFAQNIQVDSTNRKNEYRYKQYKSCLSTLLLNIYHDAVSGWLMFASLFYKTKQYSKALHIIGYSMSKCTPEKLYRYISMLDIHYQLFRPQSVQKKSLVDLQRTMLVDCIRFKPFSTLTPDELQKAEWNEPIFFPSTAYAYFLNFLCHYHLNNVRQCQDSVQGLRLVIEENYLIGDSDLKNIAVMFLRIALQLLGDNEFA